MGQIVALICAFCLLGELTAGYGYDPFSYRSPNIVRAIQGQKVEVPFEVKENNFKTVTISRNDGQEIFTSNLNVYGNYTDRFSVWYTYHNYAWTLYIDPVVKSDEGIYSCTVVEYDNQAYTKTLELQVLESSEGLRWDSSNRCGYMNILDGEPAECDPYGAYYCCSNFNWCGYTEYHCDCFDCKDYRDDYPADPPTPPCPLTYYSIEGRCLKALPEAVGLSEAPTKCKKIEAKLAIVEESDGIRDHIISFFDDPNADSATRGLFWIGYSPDTTDLESTRAELSQWNWKGTDQESTELEVNYVGSPVICSETENRPSLCDETFRRPICETAALT